MLSEVLARNAARAAALERAKMAKNNSEKTNGVLPETSKSSSEADLTEIFYN